MFKGMNGTDLESSSCFGPRVSFSIVEYGYWEIMPEHISLALFSKGGPSLL